MGEKPRASKMGKLMQIFRGRTYANPEEVLEHAAKISRKFILPGPSGKKPDATSQKILRLAPTYLTKQGYYDQVRLTNAVVAEIEKEEKRTLSGAERQKLRKSIHARLSGFKERGKLPPSTGTYKSPHRLPVLRRVTREDLQRHQGLIGLVLHRGHKWLRRDWRQGLEYSEAKEIGLAALARAIQTHREGKWAFSTVAMGNIAHDISREASIRIRQKAMEVALEDIERMAAPEEPETDTIEHKEKPLRPSKVRPENIRRDIAILLKSGQARPEHIIVHTLVGYHGNSYGAIARHMGVAKETISIAHDHALAILKRKKR